MKSSRELDALVAEKVMGWIHAEDAELKHKCDGKFHTRCGACGGFGHGNCYGYGYGYGNGAIQIECDCTPYYSTNIGTAWEVVEHFTSKGWRADVYFVPLVNEWICNLDEECNKSSFKAITVNCGGNTASHAICLAALKAMGVHL